MQSIPIETGNDNNAIAPPNQFRFFRFSLDLEDEETREIAQRLNLTQFSGLNRFMRYKQYWIDNKSNTKYIICMLDDEVHPNPQLLSINVGWKFHISICQNIEGNVARAWLLIINTLFKHNVAWAKIIHPDRKQKKGKVMTIYTFKDDKSPDQWHVIINEIERKLRNHNIIPGPMIVDDYPIFGSNYFYIRCDDDGTGQYTKVNNPANLPNPYTVLRIEENRNLELLEYELTAEEEYLRIEESSEILQTELQQENRSCCPCSNCC